ncbi:hypothetical protein C8Q76DRAFT_791243 [Earliella scabrosa]|nr:hypothetical protein C8Q76DRAFT_791243 [Earliella scabrosa]
MFLFSIDGEGGADIETIAARMFVPHIVSGFACMNFLSTLSCDLALLKGKLGCRPGAFLLYFGCRYCTLLSIISLLAYTDFMAIARIDILGYIAEATAAIALAFAYSIMAVRICTFVPNVYFCTGVEFTMLTFWALVLIGLQDVARSWRNHTGLHIAIGVLSLLLPTGALVLALFHVLYVSRAEHRFRIKECSAMLWDANVPEFAIICAVVIIATVLFFREISSSAWSHHNVSYGAFLVLYVYFRPPHARVFLTSFPMISTVVAGRLFRTMVQRLSYCPIHKNSPIFGWVKAAAVFIARSIRSDNDNEGPKHKSVLHFFCPHKPSTDRAPRHTASGRVVSFSTGGSRHGGRRRSESTCIPANSRTTYAHSSLYDSRELANSNIAP